MSTCEPPHPTLSHKGRGNEKSISHKGRGGWQAIYELVGVPLTGMALGVAARFDEKARESAVGRRGWEASLTTQLECARNLPRSLWFHCASVGEFEQAKPIVAALYPDYRIVLTCFSPSVFPAMTRYPQKDAALYLPLDSRRNVRRMLDVIQPSAVIFSKFDVWPNCVWEAVERNIPTALIAGTIHAGSKRLKPVVRRLVSQAQRQLTLQCAVSEADAERLRRLSGADSRILVTGDTRFDQVFARAEQSSKEPLLPRPDDWDGFSLVAGSVYEEDERVLIPAYVRLREEYPSARMILVPHEPTPSHLEMSETALRERGLRSLRFSKAQAGESVADMDVLLVDSVGLLARLYRLGAVAFVGGSFHARIHNVMEPAVLERPVLMGPLHDNAGEAFDLLERGAARLVRDEREFADVLLALAGDPSLVLDMGARGRAYILENLGAAAKTLEALREFVLT